MFEREVENKRRKIAGLPLLPEETIDRDLDLNVRKVFDEIEEKKNYLIKMDQNLLKKRNQELELLGYKEHYKILTEEVWEE